MSSVVWSCKNQAIRRAEFYIGKSQIQLKLEA